MPLHITVRNSTNLKCPKDKDLVLHMNKIELPEKATKKNVTNLVEVGTHILDIKPKWKKLIYEEKELLDIFLRYLLSLIIMSLWMIPIIFGLFGEYAQTPMYELPLHINLFFSSYTAFGIIIPVYLGAWKGKRFSNWIIYKALKLSKPEYEVFNAFSTLAKLLLEGNRRKTVRKLSSLRKRLWKYTEVNNDLKEYLYPELSMFKDTISLGRFILYSEKSETELSLCFLDLGLSFFHQKFLVLYSKIEELKSDIEKFGIRQPTRFERFINFLKMTEYLKNLVLIVVVIISFILWLMYGIKFTFPYG